MLEQKKTQDKKAVVGPGLLQRSRAAGAVSVPGVERHCKTRI